MLQIFAKFRTGNPTAADIKGALAALDIEGADAAVSKAEAARRAALIGGDERRLSDAESALQRARLDAERARIAADELTKRLAEAERAEAAAALDKIKADAERVRDQARQTLKREAIPAMQALCRALAMVRAADEAVTRANGQLVAAGRPAIASVESEFTPAPQGQYEALFHVAVNVRLPEIAAWRVPGWPSPRPDHWREIASAGLPAD